MPRHELDQVRAMLSSGVDWVSINLLRAYFVEFFDGTLLVSLEVVGAMMLYLSCVCMFLGYVRTRSSFACIFLKFFLVLPKTSSYFPVRSFG